MTLPKVPELVDVTPVVPDMDYTLAVINNGIVYQVLNTDGQSAALFLSSPTFIQVEKDTVLTGYLYDSKTKTFSQPE